MTRVRKERTLARPSDTPIARPSPSPLGYPKPPRGDFVLRATTGICRARTICHSVFLRSRKCPRAGARLQRCDRAASDCPLATGQRPHPVIMSSPGRSIGAPDATVIAPALSTRLPGLIEHAGRRENAGHPEADVVVPVVGFVPVAVRRAHVPGVVVPGAATKHASLRATQAPIRAPMASSPCRRSLADGRACLGSVGTTCPQGTVAKHR